MITPVSPVFGKLRQEHCEFEASIVYTVRSRMSPLIGYSIKNDQVWNHTYTAKKKNGLSRSHLHIYAHRYICNNSNQIKGYQFESEGVMGGSGGRKGSRK